jgi:hypothetical protein
MFNSCSERNLVSKTRACIIFRVALFWIETATSQRVRYTVISTLTPALEYCICLSELQSQSLRKRAVST